MLLWHGVGTSSGSIYIVSVLSINQSSPELKAKTECWSTPPGIWRDYMYFFYWRTDYMYVKWKREKPRKEIGRFTCYVRLISLLNGLCCLCCWPHSLKNQASKSFLFPQVQIRGQPDSHNDHQKLIWKTKKYNVMPQYQ